MRLSNRRLVLPSLLAALCLFLLMSNGSAQARPWIGIYMQDVTPELAEAFDLKSSHGVVVNDIAEDSPAEAAGLLPKDIIIKFNDQEVRDSDMLSELVGASKVGDKARVVVDRNGEEMSFTVEIGERKGTMEWGDGSRWAPHSFQFLERFKGTGIGISMQSLTGGLGEYFGVPRGEGALITEVMKDTPADKAGLKAGDVIVEVDNEKVATPGDVSSIIRGKDRGDKVDLTIVRNKARQKVSLEVDEIGGFGWDDPSLFPFAPNTFNWSGRMPNMRGFRFDFDQEEFQKKMEQLERSMKELERKLRDLETRME